jgi:hypothetical protein
MKTIRKQRFKYGFVPPKETVPTTIYDIYGDAITVWFKPGDTQSPENVGIGIRSTQFGMTVEKYLKML